MGLSIMVDNMLYIQNDLIEYIEEVREDNPNKKDEYDEIISLISSKDLDTLKENIPKAYDKFTEIYEEEDYVEHTFNKLRIFLNLNYYKPGDDVGFDMLSFIQDVESVDDSSAPQLSFGYSCVHVFRELVDKLYDKINQGIEITIQDVITTLDYKKETYKCDNFPAICHHCDNEGYYIPTTEILTDNEGERSWEIGSSIELLHELYKIYEAGVVNHLETIMSYENTLLKPDVLLKVDIALIVYNALHYTASCTIQRGDITYYPLESDYIIFG